MSAFHKDIDGVIAQSAQRLPLIVVIATAGRGGIEHGEEVGVVHWLDKISQWCAYCTQWFHQALTLF